MLAYNYGDFGQVYPLARGSAPLLVGMGTALFAGEGSGLPLLGVAFLAAGVMALAFDRGTGIRRNPAAVLLALGAGLFIVDYTLVDGLGARLARRRSVLPYA